MTAIKAEDAWLTDETRDLFDAILSLESVDDAAAFFRDHTIKLEG